MADHRMKGIMHQAKSSKELMQYEDKSYWSSFIYVLRVNVVL